jgi:hypothetical protein
MATTKHSNHLPYGNGPRSESESEPGNTLNFAAFAAKLESPIKKLLAAHGAVEEIYRAIDEYKREVCAFGKMFGNEGEKERTTEGLEIANDGTTRVANKKREQLETELGELKSLL